MVTGGVIAQPRLMHESGKAANCLSFIEALLLCRKSRIEAFNLGDISVDLCGGKYVRPLAHDWFLSNWLCIKIAVCDYVLADFI